MAVNGIEIEVGQKWRTRDGRIAEVRHDDGHHDFPLDIVCGEEQWSVGSNGYEFGDIEFPDSKAVDNPDHGDLIELVEHADGFKPWAGGEQPEETRGKLVVYRMGNGETSSANADVLEWGPSKGYGYHIVAYKVVAEAVQSAPESKPGFLGVGDIYLKPEPLHVELIEPEVSAPALLNAAAGHMAARASTYDKPEGERSMAQTVAVFKAHHGIELTEAQGWHFMQILKDVRLFTRESYHADSAEDCIAYAALKAEALAREGGAK